MATGSQVAGKIFDWIFSYRVRPRSGAGRGGLGLQRGGSFGSVGLRQTSEQSVQMRLPWRSITPAEMQQPLPEMSHFAAEFFRMLRKSGGRHRLVSKVRAFRAKLLAMPPASS
jgi:hypothetical protein